MIPQGRLSTIPVLGNYLPPEDSVFYALVSNELGPIAIEDTSEGLTYQNWVLSWDAASGDFIALAEITGESVVVLTVADVNYLTFTFDQNARITITYTTISSYLYWYDTSLGQTVTTDLGADVISLSISLDDKRSTKNVANDMLLWYTKDLNPFGHTLYMLRQRDRFLTEYTMETGIEKPYIQNIGMTDELRVQIAILSSEPIPLPSPIILANNDFELGDIGWIKTGDFAITQADPYEGLWSAILTTIPFNDSSLTNEIYTNVVPGQFVTVNCMVKGSIITAIDIGILFYNSSFALILNTNFTRSVTLGWTKIRHTAIAPVNALYTRVRIRSDLNSDGTISIDNFSTVL